MGPDGCTCEMRYLGFVRGDEEPQEPEPAEDESGGCAECDLSAYLK